MKETSGNVVQVFSNLCKLLNNKIFLGPRPSGPKFLLLCSHQLTVQLWHLTTGPWFTTYEMSKLHCMGEDDWASGFGWLPASGRGPGTWFTWTVTIGDLSGLKTVLRIAATGFPSLKSEHHTIWIIGWLYVVIVMSNLLQKFSTMETTVGVQAC